MIPLRLAVYGVLCLALVSGSAAAGALGGNGRKDLDLTASAHPSAALPGAADRATAVRWSDRPGVKADAVATSSATCDGCDGESIALQVLYLPWATQADLDNAATAWSSECLQCDARALSVQVVVLREWSRLVPNNRAMAVNAACESCRTAAAAFQLVVVTPDVQRMSRDALAELEAWVDEQAAALRPPVPGGGNGRPHRTDRGGNGALDSLETLVNGELDSVTAAADVVVTS